MSGIRSRLKAFLETLRGTTSKVFHGFFGRVLGPFGRMWGRFRRVESLDKSAKKAIRKERVREVEAQKHSTGGLLPTPIHELVQGTGPAA